MQVLFRKLFYFYKKKTCVTNHVLYQLLKRFPVTWNLITLKLLSVYLSLQQNYYLENHLQNGVLFFGWYKE